MNYMSVQFDKENRLTAIVSGTTAGHIPTDDNFTEGRYQRVYIDETDARAYIELGYKPPKFFHKMTYSKMMKLKKEWHDSGQVRAP